MTPARLALEVAATVGYYGWLIPATVMVYIRPARTNRFWLRWMRLGCVAFLPSYLVLTVLAPPPRWWLWILWILQAPAWRAVHRLFCRHDHTKRLRDAARGLVRRFGNRLIVVPETAS